MGKIFKIDRRGNEQWNMTLENTMIIAIQQSADGNYVVLGYTDVTAGYIDSPSIPPYAICLLKIEADK